MARPWQASRCVSRPRTEVCGRVPHSVGCGRSLTSRRETTPVLAGLRSRILCGCSSVGRARPRQGRGHEFETRHPLHVGCVRAKARVRRRACARPRSGPRAADRLVHRVVRVWAQPTWIMCLVRLTARTPGFHLGNTGSIPVRDTTTTRTSGTAATTGRRRNPSPENPWNHYPPFHAPLTQWPECRPV